MVIAASEKELKAIETNAAAYDRRCQEDLSKADTPPDYDLIAETYKAFETDNLDTISFLQSDIGVMIKLRETFPDHPTIPQYARFFISVESYEIEQTRRQIEIDRDTASTFKRLQRQ